MRNALLTLLVLSVGCSDYNVATDEDNNTGPDDEDTDIVVDPGAPDILVEPMNLSFGTRPVDCPADAQIVTVTNVGEDDLEVYDLELLGAGAGQFDLTGAPSNLASGESFTFSVDFTPGALTTFNARVQITSNDPDEGEVDVAMDGTGGENASNSDIFDQGFPEAVDVLWVLDNSCSMSDEITAVEQGLDAFIANFVTMGLDYQMGVITTDMDDAAQSGLLQGTTKVMASATMSDAQIISAFDDAVDPTSRGLGHGAPDGGGPDLAHQRRRWLRPRRGPDSQQRPPLRDRDHRRGRLERRHGPGVHGLHRRPQALAVHVERVRPHRPVGEPCSARTAPAVSASTSSRPSSTTPAGCATASASSWTQTATLIRPPSISCSSGCPSPLPACRRASTSLTRRRA